MENDESNHLRTPSEGNNSVVDEKNLDYFPLSDSMYLYIFKIIFWMIFRAFLAMVDFFCKAEEFFGFFITVYY